MGKKVSNGRRTNINTLPHLPDDFNRHLINAFCRDVRSLESAAVLPKKIGQNFINNLPNLLGSLQRGVSAFSEEAVEVYRILAQIHALEKKYVPSGELPESAVSKASAEFVQHELTMHNFNPLDPENLRSSGKADVVLLMKRFIKRVFKGFTYDEALEFCAHGPGSTSEFKGRTENYFKYGNWAVTRRARGLLKIAILKNERLLKSTLAKACNKKSMLFELDGVNDIRPAQLRSYLPSEIWKKAFNFQITRLSRVTFVPKAADEVRTIAIEPNGNIFIQLGFGCACKRRLLRVGVDLSDQTINQILAYLGSLSSEYSTLDMRKGSDSVGIFHLPLFPHKVKRFLLQTRCWGGVLPCGTEVKFRKLSSMGNGFTFPIMTLIFTSAVYAVAKMRGESWENVQPHVAVYGDDVVVPRRYETEVVDLLTYLGFTINAEKSFTSATSPGFRESCGKDYFFGHDVRPIFIKSKPATFPHLFSLRNELLWKFQNWFGFFPTNLDQTFLRFIPKYFRTFGPVIEGHNWMWSKYPREAKFIRRLGNQVKVKGRIENDPTPYAYYRVKGFRLARSSHKSHRDSADYWFFLPLDLIAGSGETDMDFGVPITNPTCVMRPVGRKDKIRTRRFYTNFFSW